MNKKGFTLVEILAVIVVLALIVSVAIPIYTGLSNNLKKNTYENKKRAIASAAIKYAAENNISTTTKFTATKLIIDNYYQAEKYSGDTPWIDNPTDANDNMACHVVEIKIDNYEYNATVSDDSECDASQNEIEDSKIKIYAYNLGSGDVLGSSICTNCTNDITWTRNNVLIGVIVDDSVLKNYTSISYTIGGNSITKERSGNEFRSFSSYANKTINIDNYVNLYKVEAALILNQQLSISLDTTDGIKTRNITVKIDKEKPIFTIDEEDAATANKDAATIYVTDGNGSGIKDVKYLRASEYNANPSATKNSAIISNIGNGNVRATLNKNMKNETYYLWATDNVGNATDTYSFQVQGIREYYIIKYNGNGGTPSKVEEKIKKGEYLTNPATADKGEEWKFLGWYTAAEGGTKVTSSYKITDDMILYAHWEKYPICTYKKYSDNKYWIGEYRCINTTAKIDKCQKKSNKVYCDGGTGNYAKTYMCTADTSTSYSNKTYCESSQTTSNRGGGLPTTETCKCQNVTLSFNLNGGSGTTPSSQTTNYGGVIDTWPNDSNTSMYKTGYTFGGWWTSASGGERVYYQTPVTQSRTLYAHWDINTYNLNIDYNGGLYNGSSSATVERNYNTTYTPSKPTRTGYTFNGWTYNGEGSWNGTTFTFTGSGNLKAQWSINSYTLTINPNGGSWNYSSSTSTRTITYNNTFTPVDPERSEYRFAGWSYSGSGSWNGSTFTATGNGTLTANWRKNNCTIRVVNGTVNGQSQATYTCGTVVTITPTIPSTRTGSWSNGNACGSGTVNQSRQRTDTRYYFSRWNDGSTTGTRSIVLNDDVTYTATITSSDTIVTQTCKNASLTANYITCTCSGSAYITGRCSDYGMADGNGEWGCWGVEGNSSANVKIKYWITDPRCPSGEHFWGDPWDSDTRLWGGVTTSCTAYYSDGSSQAVGGFWNAGWHSRRNVDTYTASSYNKVSYTWQ